MSDDKHCSYAFRASLPVHSSSLFLAGTTTPSCLLSLDVARRRPPSTATVLLVHLDATLTPSYYAGALSSFSKTAGTCLWGWRLGRAFFWSQACDASMSGVSECQLAGRRFLRLGSAAYSVGEGEGESPPSLYDCLDFVPDC